MSPPDDPRVLLGIAREDLASAEALLATQGISDAPPAFHAQQAVEKAIKAVLASHEATYPFSHDIALLIELCEDNGLEFPAQLRDAEILNPYGAAIRYGLAGSDDVDIADALRWAALAIEWAESHVDE